MTEKISLSIQYIVDSINAIYAIGVHTLILLRIGADMDASVYKAETESGQSYFVKVKRGQNYDMSVAISALLYDSGIQEIIPPLKTLDGELAKRIDDFTLTLYPFVDRENGFRHNLTDNQWVTLGKVLRQIHEFDVPSSMKDRIRKETYSGKWWQAVRSLDAHIDGKLTGDETALKLQEFMKRNRAIINRLVDRAEYLSRKIEKRSPESVLCHSDIHGGNVLIDGNGSIYIVDWDEPIMAPKERDLMFIGGGVANRWNIPRDEEFFYKGYGETKIDMELLAYYRHERIVQDIAEYWEALLLHGSGGEERLEMYKQFLDMFEPNGVVDIAFQTDRGFSKYPSQ